MSNSNCNVGDGVLIAVDSGLKSKTLNVSINSVEHLFVHLQLGSTTYILCCVYIPPRSNIIMYENCFTALNELYQNNLDSKIIVLGDFNLPSLIWSDTTLPTT